MPTRSRSRHPKPRFCLFALVVIVIVLATSQALRQPPVHRESLPKQHHTGHTVAPHAVRHDYTGWTTWPTALPVALEGLAATTTGSTIYVAGGINGETSQNTLFALHGGHVTRIATLAEPVHDAALSVWQHHLFLLGGGQTVSENRVWSTSLPPTEMTRERSLPKPLSDLDTVTTTRGILIIGGHNIGSPSTTIWIYQPDRPARALATIPMGVRYPAVAVSGSTLYVVGGYLASGAYTNQALAVNIKTGHVTELAPYPLSLQYAMGATYHGHVVVAGGQTASGWTAASYRWSSSKHRWITMPALPTPRGYGAMVAYQDGLVVIGGEGTSGALDSIVETSTP